VSGAGPEPPDARPAAEPPAEPPEGRVPEAAPPVPPAEGEVREDAVPGPVRLAASSGGHSVDLRFYRLAAGVAHPLLRAWLRVRVHGAANIPATGPLILAANHRSNLDPPLVSMVTKRPVFYMAKIGLFRFPLGQILRRLGQIPVRRGGSDREALRVCQEVVDDGGVLGLFPEGTRCAGRFETIHPGLAYMLVRTNCPVIPIVLTGTDGIRRRFGWLPRATSVRIVVGPPLDLPAPRRGRDARREASEALRRQLQAFLEQVEARPAGRLAGGSVQPDTT
jgi:1-acyl-sn-glycerol-3-phosphate acyltransferase